jgi:hypothetical protein
MTSQVFSQFVSVKQVEKFVNCKVVSVIQEKKFVNCAALFFLIETLITTHLFRQN